MDHAFERLTLQPDLVRALRATTAFTLALLGCLALGEPLAAPFAATAALAASMPHLRGAYPVRVAVIACIIAIFTGATLLGASLAGKPAAAVAGIGLLALLGGVWRHLSADYGPPVSVDSGLLYLLALDAPSRGASPAELALWTALGGGLAALLHLGLWLFRPQHPLRHAVAECWVAASDLFLALRCSSATAAPAQRALREALDRATAILKAAEQRQPAALLTRLDHLRHEAAHLAMRTAALHTAVDPQRLPAASGALAAAWDAAFVELANLARSVAIALITHRADQGTLTAARLQNCLHRLEALAQQGLAQQHLLAALQDELGALQRALDPTLDAATRQTLFPLHLPDLSRRSMRALAGWINTAPGLDPILVRHALRMALLSMLAVAIYQVWAIPRGYWMAFAILVVLQPDYGSTRLRAGQRVAGTLAGVVLGSGLLLVSLPLWLLALLSSLTAFGFTYLLRRQYALAVLLVTVQIVLITELHAPVHFDFTLERLLCNLAGSGLALFAAKRFWPSWEREQFPALLARAIERNGEYGRRVAAHLLVGQAFGPDLIHAKQQTERSGLMLAASLARMITEPRREQAEPARATLVVSANERLTRALSALATHLPVTPSPGAAGLTRTLEAIEQALDFSLQAIRAEPADGAEPVPLAPAPEPPVGALGDALAQVLIEARGLAMACRSLRVRSTAALRPPALPLAEPAPPGRDTRPA